MMNIKQSLTKDIMEGVQKALDSGDLTEMKELPAVLVESTGDSAHGDYASPVAMSIGKVAGKNPMDIVELIVGHMPKREYVEKMEVAAPGFLNIWISRSWMVSRLDDVIGHNMCDDIAVGEGLAVNLEFISANPTGPLTLGNIRTAFSADTLGKVMECAGYNVTREYYFNDAGVQVKKLGESVVRRILQSQGEEVEFAEDLYQGEYISDIGSQIVEQWKENNGKEFSVSDLEDEKVMGEVVDVVVKILFGQIKKTIVDDLKIDFDVWTSEKSLHDDGSIEKVLDVLREKGVTYKKDGAEYFKTTDFGDDKDRVIVKSSGEYAYIAPDIGYHQNKYDRKYDHILTFIGADHQGHLSKITAAMEVLGNDVSKLHFVVSQWMSLKRDGEVVKPSKRKGNIYGPKELIDEIGYDSTRFFMIQHSLSSQMELDLDLAKERSDRNPVFYVQYAYVRLQAILRKAKEKGVIEGVGDAVNSAGAEFAVLGEDAEIDLMRALYRLPEVSSDIAQTFEVHKLAYYAHDLAKYVHAFYNQVPVLSVQDEVVMRGKLQLVIAARDVLGKTLDLLGLSKPDVM